MKWFEGAKAKKNGQAGKGNAQTVADVWAAYIADAEMRGVKGTKIMTQTAKAHILPSLGPLPVAELTLAGLKDWHYKLSLAPRRSNRILKEGEEPPKAVKPSKDAMRARRNTANRILTNLKAALNFVFPEGEFGGPTPWRSVKPFKGTTSKRIRFLTSSVLK